MEDCIRKDPVDLLKYQDEHWHFHERIMTISTNKRLKRFSASLHHQVSRFSYLSLQGKTHLNASAKYHRWIIDAIKNKEKSKACKLMKKHVLRALDVVQKKIEFDDPESSHPLKKPGK